MNPQNDPRILPLPRQTPTAAQIMAQQVANLVLENSRLMERVGQLEAQIQAMMEANNAKQEQAPSQANGSGGPRPEVREEGGSAAISGEGIQQG